MTYTHTLKSQAEYDAIAEGLDRKFSSSGPVIYILSSGPVPEPTFPHPNFPLARVIDGELSPYRHTIITAPTGEKVVKLRNYGTAECTSCGNTFPKPAANSMTCSHECRKAHFRRWREDQKKNCQHVEWKPYGSGGSARKQREACAVCGTTRNLAVAA